MHSEIRCKFMRRSHLALGAKLSQYGDYATGWTTGVRLPARSGIFSLRHYYVQTDSRAHPASYLVGSGGSYPVDKAAGA